MTTPWCHTRQKPGWQHLGSRLNWLRIQTVACQFNQCSDHSCLQRSEIIPSSLPGQSKGCVWCCPACPLFSAGQRIFHHRCWIRRTPLIQPQTKDNRSALNCRHMRVLSLMGMIRKRTLPHLRFHHQHKTSLWLPLNELVSVLLIHPA